MRSTILVLIIEDAPPVEKGEKDMRILLLRHGQSEANKEHIIQGHMDSPLSDLGRDQAKNVGKKLLDSEITFDAVYSSDLIRAKETAKIITKILGVEKIAFDKLH